MSDRRRRLVRILPARRIRARPSGSHAGRLVRSARVRSIAAPPRASPSRREGPPASEIGRSAHSNSSLRAGRPGLRRDLPARSVGDLFCHGSDDDRPSPWSIGVLGRAGSGVQLDRPIRLREDAIRRHDHPHGEGTRRIFTAIRGESPCSWPTCSRSPVTKAPGGLPWGLSNTRYSDSIVRRSLERHLHCRFTWVSSESRFAVRRVGALIGHPGMDVKAALILDRVFRLGIPHALDVLAGDAGAIPALLAMGHEPRCERCRELAISLGERLVRARCTEGTLAVGSPCRIRPWNWLAPPDRPRSWRRWDGPSPSRAACDHRPARLP